MFGIEIERWFSLFKRGIELLGEMSTFSVFPGVASVAQFPQPLQTGNARRKVPCTRNILIQKARVAGFRGHGVPHKLGKASQANWARRPRQIGQGVPGKLGMASHSKWARRPGETGHDVPPWSAENITLFGNSLVRTFFPHSHSISLGRQAMAASDWIKDSSQWQQYPWYEPILGYFQFFSPGKAANEMSTRQCPRGPQCPIFQKAATEITMVAGKHTRSQCPKFNKPWCGSHLRITQQPFIASLLQKSGRNEPSMGNNSGIFGRWCHKRNSFATSKTSNPLVCDKKGRKAPTNYKLQGAQQLPGAKTFQVGKLARNFSLFKERNVGSQNRFEACLF
jgi:hypothetical protein